MNVGDTLKCMLINYPALFNNKYACAEFLFLGFGNGYEWKRGELVFDVETKVPTAFNPKKLEGLRGAYEIAWAKLRLEYIDEITEVGCYRSVRAAVGHHERDPSTKYAPIFNVPHDITDEWLKFAEDFARTWRFKMASVDLKVARIIDGALEHLAEVEKKRRKNA